jgi:hypothetical protein
MTGFKPIQSLSRCDDFDTLHFINGQHTWLISGNDQVGVAGNGGCENDIVVRIGRIVDLRHGRHHDRSSVNVFQKVTSLLRAYPVAKPRIAQRPQQFIELRL